MDDGGPTASIIAYVALLLADMFFYGFGAALGSLNEKEMERRAEEEKDKKAIRLKAIISDPFKYENTVQMITSLINVIIGAVHLVLLLHAVANGLSFVAERQLGLESIPVGIIMAAAAILSTLLLLYITLTLGVLLPTRLTASPSKFIPKPSMTP